MSGKLKHWEKGYGESVFEKIGGKLHRAPPLKERIANTIYRLRLQKEKLQQTGLKMEQRSRELFEKCANAQIAKDYERANIYANECAEVRKMAKVILLGELAIEQVIVRLETVEEFGDVVVEMGPVAKVIQSLRAPLAGVVPEVSFELGKIGETLGDMVVEAGEVTGRVSEVGTSSEEARKILEEAGTVAEQRMKERFPELPAAALPTPERESTLPK